MTISVIIPTYNRAGYLRQAIESALNQSHRDLEVIVVDDGSTDETPALMRAPAERVRYVRTEHVGLAHARNTGLRLASGDAVTFLDSDDLLYPYKLELQARVLEAYPDVQMVYTECSSFDDRGDRERFHLRTYHSAYRNPDLTYDRIFETSVNLKAAGLLPGSLQSSGDAIGRRAYFGNIFDSYLRNVIVFHNSTLIRRAVLDEVGDHDETLTHFLEMDLLLRICRKHRVAFIDVPTYKLRYHPRQMSSTSGRGGSRVAVHKQHSLLRVVRRHIRSDPDYYNRHRADLDRHLARLHRAVAVPLLSYRAGHAGSDYSARARLFLSRCRELHQAEPFLWSISFLEPQMRRLAFALRVRAATLRQALRGRARGRGRLTEVSTRLRKAVATSPTVG